MEQFKRSWDITKATFSLINSDRKMLLFPLLGGIFSVIILLLFAIPFLAATIVQDVSGAQLGSGMFYILLFLFYLCVTFVSVFCNVGVIYIAKSRFENKKVTFGQAVSFAFSQFKEILLWSIVSAIVGVLLNIIENIGRNRNGQPNIVAMIMRSVLGAAWSIATLFVVPIIVYKDLSPFEAIKESLRTVRKTWGESLIRHFGLGIIQTVVTIIGVVIGIILIMLAFSIGFLPLVMLGFALTIIFVVVVSLVFSVANAVFNTALYVYATTGKTPQAYTSADMKDALGNNTRNI